LQLQLEQFKQGQPAAVVAPPDATQAPIGRSYSGTSGYNRSATTQPQVTGFNGEVQTGTTATGIPTYTGPGGGTYHYSKSGNKVYEKHK